jgi:branched-chain amino acid transport system substrate-binding protein
MLWIFRAALVLFLAAAGPANAEQPIKVGVALSQTGSLADSAEHIRRGLVLWQEEANKRGGLIGRPVELVMYDDRSDTATASKLTERLITVDNVDVLIAPFGSGATAAASAVSERHKRVMINVAGAAEQIHQRGFKYIFQVVPPIGDYVKGVFHVAKASGLQTVAFASRDYVASRNAEGSVRGMAKALGMEVVLSEYFPAGTVDFGSIIARMRQLRPDVWISISYPNEAIDLVKQMKAANYAPAIFISNGVSQEDFIRASGKDADFAFGISKYEPDQKTAGNAEVVQRFKSRWKEEPGYYAAMAWAGMEVVGEAVRTAGGTDQDKMRAAILAMRMETPFGPFAVDEAGLQTAKKAMVVQVQNGRREIVWPFDVQTAKAVVPMPAWDARR